MYTLSRNQWWLWCSDFLLVPTVFFLAMFSFSFLIFISAQLFYIISRLIFPDLVTFPVIYRNFHFLLGAFSFSFFQDSTFGTIVLLQVSRNVVRLVNTTKKQSNVVASNSFQVGTTRLWVEYNAGFTHSCGIQFLNAVILFCYFCNINIQ